MKASLLKHYWISASLYALIGISISFGGIQSAETSLYTAIFLGTTPLIMVWAIAFLSAPHHAEAKDSSQTKWSALLEEASSRGLASNWLVESFTGVARLFTRHEMWALRIGKRFPGLVGLTFVSLCAWFLLPLLLLGLLSSRFNTGETWTAIHTAIILTTLALTTPWFLHWALIVFELLFNSQTEHVHRKENKLKMRLNNLYRSRE